MNAYGDPNIDDEQIKREKKKKRHKKRQEDAGNYDDNMNPSYGRDDRRSEEENFDPGYNHGQYQYNDGEDYPENGENGQMGYEDEDEEERKRKRRERRKKKKRQKELEEEEMQRQLENDSNYPFEGERLEYPNHAQVQEAGYSDDNDDHLDYHDNPEDIPVENGQPDSTGMAGAPVPKEKKKSGGFGKIFASFKKKKQPTPSESSASGGNAAKLGEGWESNPEIFNPAYDGNSSRSSKKVKGKSTRDIPGSNAKVILLDGEEVQFQIDTKSKGQELFDQACSALDLQEKDYFGLTYVSRKLETWFWLELDKKINKQLATGDEWIFNFQVKFYPPEPVLLQEDVTRYLLCLQVRQDVYTSKLPCSWITQALLGSFLVQSELGDYDPELHDDPNNRSGNTSTPYIEYLREFEFVYGQTDQLLEKIAELHRKHAGMSPDKADVKYLETAKRLELYGVDLHPVRDNDNLEIFLGVCYQGVLIYRGRDRIGRFAWPKVLRISYKKNYFYLKIRSDRLETSEAIVGFKVYRHELAKRLWKNAVEQHTFFRMKEPTLASNSGMRRGSGGGSLFPIRSVMTNTTKPGFTGKTLYQYRTMDLKRNAPARFDRSMTKRRTIGSMPDGLNRAGMYGSMHSLNRAHPRDMTLGKTKSIEYLPGKKPASTIGISSEHNSLGRPAGGGTSSILNRSNLGVPVAAPRHHVPAYGSVSSYRDDSQHSFRSGDSINAADSYAVRQDDQVSLPPMPSIPTQPIPVVEVSGKKKKHSSRKQPKVQAQPVAYSDEEHMFAAESPPPPPQPLAIVTGSKPRVPKPQQQIYVNQRSPSISSNEEPIPQVPENRRHSRTKKKMILQPPAPAIVAQAPIPSPPRSAGSSSPTPPHTLPPPPPPIDDHTTIDLSIQNNKPQPPPVKPKPPVVKPKPKINLNNRPVPVSQQRQNYRRDYDYSSNDDML